MNKKQIGKRFMFQNYIKFINEIISCGNDITLSKIRDMINTNKDTGIKNNVVKVFIEKFFGNSIQFCESYIQKQSSMVFSSPLDITDVINTLRSLDGVKSAARNIRNVHFGLKEKFFDARELKLACRTTKIPDEVLAFFFTTFQYKKDNDLQKIDKD